MIFKRGLSIPGSVLYFCDHSRRVAECTKILQEESVKDVHLYIFLIYQVNNHLLLWEDPPHVHMCVYFSYIVRSYGPRDEWTERRTSPW